MIAVSLLGMDSYEAIKLSKKMHAKLVNAYSCRDEDLVFFAPDSFIIHDGVEQTSFRLNITVEAPVEYENKEREVRDIIFESLKDIAVHYRLLFTYFETEHEYVQIDDTYPEYMTEENMVKADDHDHDEDDEDENYDEEYNEPYMGDIIGEFDKYIQAHPDATNEEVYKALTDIREEVTSKHHNED